MVSKSETLPKRLWLLGVVLVCLVALLCGAAPPQAHALSRHTIKVFYDFQNGTTKETTTTSGNYLYLPITNPTNGNKLFLGWHALSANNDSDGFPWNWYTLEPPKFEAIDQEPPTGFAPTDFSLDEDTTVTAQWASTTPVKLNSTYQAMLSDNSPLGGSYPVKVYSATLTKGTTYHIQTWLPGGDSYLLLYDKNLNEIDHDDNSCPDYDKGYDGYGYLNNCGAYIEFTPEETGMYYFFSSTYSGYGSIYSHGMSYFRIGTSKLEEPRNCVSWISQNKVIKRTYVAAGRRLEAIKKPVRKGYTLAGWYRNASLTNKIDFSTYRVPTSDINVFAKWTSNDSHIKALKATAGKLTQKWTTKNFINTLALSKSTPSATIRPIRSNSKATVYMKYAGGTYKKMSSMRVSVAKGHDKAVYIKCVSQTGSKYKTVYKVYVRRAK